MAKLTLSQAGQEFPVNQYPMPVKGKVVNLTINGEAAEARVTNARGKTYTYFSHGGGEFYVPGELAEGQDAEFKLPDGFQPRELKSRAEQYEAIKAQRLAKKAATQEGGVPDEAPAADVPNKSNKRSKKSKEQEAAAQAWGVGADGGEAAKE